MLDVPSSVRAREFVETVTPALGAGGSEMLKSPRLSVSLTPPAPVRPVLVMLPRPITTVSAVLSVVLSAVALRVIVAVVAVAPDSGPVNTTVAVPLSRLLYCTPSATVPVMV